MARFQRRYSDAQDRAIIAAQVDHGLSARLAAEAAAAGELPGAGGLAPFKIPAGTARDKASAERRKRRTAAIVAGGPSAALEGLAGRVLSMLEREALRIERAAQRGEIDPARIGALARAGREAAQLVKVSRRTPAPVEEGASSPDEPDETDYLAGLAGKA